MTQEIIKTRRYLGQIRQQDEKIEATKKRIKTMRCSEIYLSGILYDRERVQTSPSGAASYEDRVIEIADLEKEARAQIIAAEKTKQDIMARICIMEDQKSAHILYQRFVEGMTNQEIADADYVSEQWVRHQAADALKIFYQDNLADIEDYAARHNF